MTDLGGARGRAAGELRPGVRRAAGEEQSRDGHGGDDHERALAGGDRTPRRRRRADDALVGALDREVDGLGDREGQSLATRAARTTGVTDAEDVQEHADRHQDAAGHDERAGPRCGARDRPRHADLGRRGGFAVRRDDDAHVFGELERGDQEVLLLEFVQPQIRADRAARFGRFRFRIRRRGRFRGLACIGHRLVLDGRGDGIRDDLAGSSEGDLVVGRVGEPGLEIGRPAVRGEDLPLALRTQRLGTRELVEDRTVDQQIRCVFRDRDGDGFGLRALEDGALSDARADHHSGQHECRHSPHETHENTSPGPAGECGGPSTRHFRLAKDT